MPEETPEGFAEVQINDKDNNPVGDPIKVAITPAPSVTPGNSVDTVQANNKPVTLDDKV